VISRSLWETRFESDPNVVGKAISLGGEPHTIVGVLGDFPVEDLIEVRPRSSSPSNSIPRAGTAAITSGSRGDCVPG
jgi:hypothetical protein